MSDEIQANKTSNNLIDNIQINTVISILKNIFSTSLGINIDQIDIHANFYEIGLESLNLLQIPEVIKSEFGINLSLRLFFEKILTINDLAIYITQQMQPEKPTLNTSLNESVSTVLPPELTPQQISVKASDSSLLNKKEENAVSSLPLRELSKNEIQLNSDSTASQNEILLQESTSGQPTANTAMERLITQQLMIMSKQLDLMRKNSSSKKTILAPSKTVQSEGSTKASQSQPSQVELGKQPIQETLTPLPVVASEQTEKRASESLNPRQQKHLDSLIARVVKRTQESKRLTQSARPFLANPRSITGFRLSIKEILYPIHIQSGCGAKILDVDGNEYIDLSMGFGPLLFGHSPSFVIEAIQEHIQRGMQNGLQSHLTGKVSELFCELTGQERVSFCNDGTEAVMGAIRIARAATGRSKIAVFANSYHGNLDEVLVAGIPTGNPEDGMLRSLPIALGIPQHMTEKVIVLNYGSHESLNILKANAHELAAVLVEPVQSRNPDCQPKEFLYELRKLTQQTGIVLIFDEVITGMRMHPRGIQGLWGIQADITTYGKAVASGLPIGVVAGKAIFMDALDGGFWNYGDASYPQAAKIRFAGTFFKNPLVMAVVWVVLNHIKNNAPKLQEELAQKTKNLADTLNSYFAQKHLPIQVVYFGSLFRFTSPPNLTWINLLFYHLLEKGIYIWEGRTCFLSTAHTNEDIEQVIRAIKESIVEMQEGGFLPPDLVSTNSDDLINHQVSKLLDRQTDSSSGLGNEPSPIIASTGSNKNIQLVRDLLLTEAQKQLWFMSQMGGLASRAYNLSNTIHLRGSFNLNAVHKAIQEAVNRHEALRTTFSLEGDYQRIHSTLTIDIPLLDFSTLDKSEGEVQLSNFLGQEVQHIFDLEKGPLLRTQIVKLTEQYHLLVLTIHHIIADGWSLSVLLQELYAIYIAECQGSNHQLPQPMQLSEYALSEVRQQESPEMSKAEAYWLKQFADSVPVLELPTDRPRPLVNTHNGTRQSITLSTFLSSALKSLSVKLKTTLFTTLLTVFIALLHRLTGQDDIVVGVSLAGQSSIGSEYLIGHCVKLLPLRSHMIGNLTFVEYVGLVKQLLLDAYDNKIYPFSKLVKNLNIARDSSRSPLLTTIFNMDRSVSWSESLSKEVDIVKNSTNSSISDILFDISQKNNEILVECEYNTDLFNSQTIERWMEYWQTLLEGIVANPEQRVLELPILTESEQDQLLIEWNHPQIDYPQKQSSIHQLFEAQVYSTPDAIAVVEEDNQLTYQELNAKANQLAHYLRSLGVKPEILVGICTERSSKTLPQASLSMVVGLLAILKAGGAYVPLDPTYPQERLAFMLSDSQLPVLLTQQHLIENLPLHQTKIVCLDTDWQRIAQESQHNPNSECTSDNLAYIIYTSGSTGQPKGVLVNHANVVRLLAGTDAWYNFNQQDIFSQFHSYAFDFSVWEIWSALLSGGKLVIVPYWLSRSPEDFYKFLLTRQVTVLNQTPSAFHQLIQAEESLGDANKLSLRLVIFGGEALKIQNLRPWFERHGDQFPQLINMYGITETTVHVTYRPLRMADLEVVSGSVIGRPIPDLQVYLLDEYQQPVPMGVRGEMYVGGAGVARGYLNRPELTALKFIPNLLSDQLNTRLYKTGDLARYLPNGDIEYLGRIDHQVKIRGFRIELSEIEAVIYQHPAVRETVVIVGEDSADSQRLIAYTVLHTNQTLTITQLRHFLESKLPIYMVPAAFVMLEALPLTLNGKVNRKALPVPDRIRPELEKSWIAPETTVEKQLTVIWEQVLGLENISINNNFFELGGDSILSLQIISKAKLAGLHFTPKQLFQHQTIAQLAVVASTTKTIQAEQVVITGTLPLTPIQQWFFEQEQPEPHHWNQAVLLELSQSINPIVLEQAIQSLQRHHDALRSRFLQEEFGTQAVIVSSDDAVPLTHLDLSALSKEEQAAAMEATAAKLQACLNLSVGPLFQVALFDLGRDKPCRLLWAIHHLVVDGVSWRILIEDFHTAYQQLCHGKEIQLPPKTTSFKQWSHRLQEYAQSSVLRKDLDYWLTTQPQPVKLIHRDFPHGENTEATACKVSVSLSVDETQVLLQQVPAAYRTQINDILLTALTQTFTQWTGENSLLIDLEGHGREELFEDVDLSRTVGWFTSVFPVCLSLENTDEPGKALMAIKEQLRAIPNRGIGYGLLYYLTKEQEIQEQLRSLPKAEVVFNYLGQFDQVLPESSLFSLAQESIGSTHSWQSKRDHLLEINGGISQGRLQMHWTYSQKLHRQTTVERLAEGFIDALRSLIAHCQSLDTSGFTPSDFAEFEQSQWSQADLDAITIAVGDI